jgi:hypothetical protein
VTAFGEIPALKTMKTAKDTANAKMALLFISYIPLIAYRSEIQLLYRPIFLLENS